MPLQGIQLDHSPAPQVSQCLNGCHGILWASRLPWWLLRVSWGKRTFIPFSHVSRVALQLWISYNNKTLSNWCRKRVSNPCKGEKPSIKTELHQSSLPPPSTPPAHPIPAFPATECLLPPPPKPSSTLCLSEVHLDCWAMKNQCWPSVGADRYALLHVCDTQWLLHPHAEPSGLSFMSPHFKGYKFSIFVSFSSCSSNCSFLSVFLNCESQPLGKLWTNVRCAMCKPMFAHLWTNASQIVK